MLQFKCINQLNFRLISIKVDINQFNAMENSNLNKSNFVKIFLFFNVL